LSQISTALVYFLRWRPPRMSAPKDRSDAPALLSRLSRVMLAGERY
jgi:hypothetical protein